MIQAPLTCYKSSQRTLDQFVKTQLMVEDVLVSESRDSFLHELSSSMSRWASPPLELCSAPAPAYTPEQQQARSGDAFRLCGPEISAVAVGFFALSFRCGWRRLHRSTRRRERTTLACLATRFSARATSPELSRFCGLMRIKPCRGASMSQPGNGRRARRNHHRYEFRNAYSGCGGSVADLDC